MPSSYHYDLSSQFNRYDIKLPRCISPPPLSTIIAPPSYSQVLLEKLQSQQRNDQTIATWEKNLRELKESVENAKNQIYKAQVIMQDIQYRCIRLECKNEYLLEHLKQTSELVFSLTNPVHEVNNDIIETEDSLSRMNVSVETLIQEAHKSLTSHFSLKPDSVRLKRTRSHPCFTELNYPENRRKSSHQPHQINNGDTFIDLKKKYQKARYFHSQWKLINTMRQLLESVKRTTEVKQGTKAVQQQQQRKVKQMSPANTTKHVHIHHHHHHIHHHHHLSTDINTPSPSTISPVLKTFTSSSSSSSSSNDSFISKIKSQTSITAKNATTSLLQYVGIMPSEDKIKNPPLQKTLVNNDNGPVKYRTMFLATMLIMQTFNHSPHYSPRQKPIWAMRGNRLAKRWRQQPTLKRLLPIWLRKAHLVFYLARCFTIK